MRTANPALSDRYFAAEAQTAPRSNVMTVNGAVVKTGILSALLVAAGGLAWTLVRPAGSEGFDPTYRMLFGLGAPLAGFVVALITCFFPKASPVTAPLYAVLQGLFLGAVSSFFNAQYQGIVLEAATLTVGVLVVMLLAYTSGLIRATEKFKLGVIAATGAIFLFYLAVMLLGLFGVGGEFRATVLGAGPIGIGFSVIVCIIAALNLVLDFDVIETGARYGAPKYMEWFAAFGLMVTLVWLYLEILRLLAKLRSGD
jgi:uncharacterized YccA/Bax inhibitor family protein